jgi:hypothetical protein
VLVGTNYKIGSLHHGIAQILPARFRTIEMKLAVIQVEALGGQKNHLVDPETLI